MSWERVEGRPFLIGLQMRRTREGILWRDDQGRELVKKVGEEYYAKLDNFKDSTCAAKQKQD